MVLSAIAKYDAEGGAECDVHAHLRTPHTTVQALYWKHQCEAQEDTPPWEEYGSLCPPA